MNYPYLAKLSFRFWYAKRMEMLMGGYRQGPPQRGLEAYLENLKSEEGFSQEDMAFIEHSLGFDSAKAKRMAEILTHIGHFCRKEDLKFEAKPLFSDQEKSIPLDWTLAHLFRLIEPKYHYDNIDKNTERIYQYEYFLKAKLFEENKFPYEQCLYCGSTPEGAWKGTQKYCSELCKKQMLNRISRFKQIDIDRAEKSTNNRRSTAELTTDFQGFCEEIYQENRNKTVEVNMGSLTEKLSYIAAESH